jgi:hypothetical protein
MMMSRTRSGGQFVSVRKTKNVGNARGGKGGATLTIESLLNGTNGSRKVAAAAAAEAGH